MTQTISKRWVRFIGLSALVFIAIPACGDDDEGVGLNGGLVGGACRDHYDCAERCLGGGDFPSGTCSINCRDDRDCPSGTYCVERAGGVCLLSCERPSHCRPGYNCKAIDNAGHGGDSLVCIH